MQFRIADTLADSLARLTGDEQRAVKTAAFDLRMNPAHPELKLYQVGRAKDKDFWSAAGQSRHPADRSIADPHRMRRR